MRYRPRPLLAFAALSVALTACDGLKEALTAHVDVVARAGSQELSVTRLAELLGNAKVPVPVTKENAQLVTDLWVNYQLVAHAAAVGDSLSDKKLVDIAAAPIVKNMKLRKYMDSITKTFKVDSAGEASYNAATGGLYAARHILFGFPQGAPGTPAPQAVKDSVRAKAQAVLPTVTDANFAALVAKHSTEPGAGQRGGSLGVFQKGQMVAPFSAAVASLKPGQISPTLVETQFGYHIIQRLPFSAIDREQYKQLYSRAATNVQDSAFIANLEKQADIQVKSSAVAAARAAAQAPAKHRKDDGVLATYKGGDLSVSEFVTWVEGFPPQAQIARQIGSAPDSLVTSFVKSIAEREVLLARADSAKIGMSAEEQANLYRDFSQLVGMVQSGIGVEPKSLQDSAKSAPERERLAANRVEALLDRILAGQAQPVPVPPPLATVLQAKYESSVNSAGVERAVERAQKLRAAADSVRAANQPKSEVPIPGMPGAGAPGGGRPVQPQPQPQPVPPPSAGSAPQPGTKTAPQPGTKAAPPATKKP